MIIKYIYFTISFGSRLLGNDRIQIGLSRTKSSFFWHWDVSPVHCKLATSTDINFDISEPLYIYIYIYIYESANWMLILGKCYIHQFAHTPSFLQNNRKFDLRLCNPEAITPINRFLKKSRRRCATYGRDVVSYCYLRFCNHSTAPWLTSSSVPCNVCSVACLVWSLRRELGLSLAWHDQ